MDQITEFLLAAATQLIGVPSKVIKHFNMKEVPNVRAKHVQEATGLLALFIDLRYWVAGTNSTDPWFVGLRSHGGKENLGNGVQNVRRTWLISWHRQQDSWIY